MLYILKIPTKYGVVLQSFCQNQNPAQDQDQHQDYDFTLDFNNRPTFHTKKPTKFFSHPLIPSKVIVSTARIHVRTYVQPGRQTDRRIFFACFVFLEIQNMNIHQKERFFFQSGDYNIFSFYILRMWWESKNVLNQSAKLQLNRTNDRDKIYLSIENPILPTKQ